MEKKDLYRFWERRDEAFDNMLEPFELNIDMIQPSQLFVSNEKLTASING